MHHYSLQSIADHAENTFDSHYSVNEALYGKGWIVMMCQYLSTSPWFKGLVVFLFFFVVPCKNGQKLWLAFLLLSLSWVFGGKGVELGPWDRVEGLWRLELIVYFGHLKFS